MTAVFMVLTAAVVNINSTDWSDHSSKTELTVKVDAKDVTTWASAGWKEVKGGLKSGQLALSLKNDRQASNLDASLWALFGTVVTFYVQAASGTVTTSNPRYGGSILIEEWKPLTGSVGDVDELDVSFPTSGAVTRLTS